MNKKKSLLLVILSVIAVFALVLSFGCKKPVEEEGGVIIDDNNLLTGNYEGDDDDVVEDPADQLILQSISLDLTGVKTTYQYGEEFDQSKKPVVTASLATLESVIKHEETKFLLSGGEPLDIKTQTVTDITVDYGQYDKTAVGTYTIYVSYTHAGVTRSAHYEVEVVSDDPAIGGLTVRAEDGFKTSYTIESKDGITITGLDLLKVYTVDSEMNETEVALSDCTVEYYHNGTKVDNIETVTVKGDYTIMVKYNNASAFVVVEVLDPIVSFALVEDSDPAPVKEQIQLPEDLMTPTWIFRVTYTSTNTLDVKVGDAGLSISGMVTVTAAESRTAKIVYVEGNETKTVTVDYKITKNDDLTSKERSFSHAAIKGIEKDSQAMSSNDLVGVNSFITIPSGSATVRYRTATYIDFASGDPAKNALEIEYNGFGTLELGIRSTGSGKNSSVAILPLYEVGEDEEAPKYISASGWASNIAEYNTEDGYVYVATDEKSAGFVDISFTIPAAGRYAILAPRSVSALSGQFVSCESYTRLNKLDMVDVFDKNIDVVDYSFTVDATASELKKGYIAGETEIDLTGLTATITEEHSKEGVENVTASVDVSKLTAEFTDCDWTKLGSKGKITVKYTHTNGIEYKATYEITILSPVAVGDVDVDKVVGVKETAIINLAEGQTTAEIVTTDITIHANSESGAAITIDGTDNTVTYKLYNGETEITETPWTVEAGTYTIKATVTLKNTKAVEGSTVFIADIIVKINEYVPAGESKEYEDFFLANVGSADAFTATEYAANGEITSNTLFEINASVAAATHIGNAYGAIQNGSNALQFTDTKGNTHNPDIGIRHGEDVAADGKLESIYTVTAKDNITLYLYVVFTNNSYNSNRENAVISYSVTNGASGTATSAKRNTVTKIEVRMNKGATLTVGVSDNKASAGRLWLFGAEAKKEDGPVATVTYYDVEFHINNTEITTLTAPETQKIAEGEKATAPEALPAVAGWEFGGWYTTAACDGTAYDFDTAVSAKVDLYAKWTAVTSATVTFNANGHGTAPEAQTLNIGDKATNIAIRAQGYTFGGWYTTEACDGTAYDFDTAVSGNVTLYAKWTAIDYSTPQTFTYTYGDIAAKEDNAVLTDDDLVGANAFLTVATAGKVKYRTSNSAIELKDDAIKVTFVGNGTLKIKYSSTGGSNYSALIVKDKNGNYLTANYTAADNISVETSDKGNIYVVKGTTAYEFTFDISEAGEYIIGTVTVDITGVEGSSTKSNTRVREIVMVDNGTSTTPEGGEPEVTE